MRKLLTGGCGFIGSAPVRPVLRRTGHEIVDVDLAQPFGVSLLGWGTSLRSAVASICRGRQAAPARAR